MNTTFTNYGNKYKFQAIIEKRSSNIVMLQKKLKSGKWGKPIKCERYGSEKTAEEVIARLEKNNPGSEWRIAE